MSKTTVVIGVILVVIWAVCAIGEWYESGGKYIVGRRHR